MPRSRWRHFTWDTLCVSCLCVHLDQQAHDNLFGSICKETIFGKRLNRFTSAQLFSEDIEQKMWHWYFDCSDHCVNLPSRIDLLFVMCVRFKLMGTKHAICYFFLKCWWVTAGFTKVRNRSECVICVPACIESGCIWNKEPILSHVLLFAWNVRTRQRWERVLSRRRKTLLDVLHH